MSRRPHPADLDVTDEEYARHYAKRRRPSAITDPRDPAYDERHQPREDTTWTSEQPQQEEDDTWHL